MSVSTRQMETLVAIHQGKPYSRSNRILAPLCANGYIIYKGHGTKATAEITEWGKIIARSMMDKAFR